MRAAILSKPRTIEATTLDRPAPRPGEVVVRVEATAICGSDINAYRGVHPRIKPPTVLGHEVAGTVEELGRDVDENLAGARVCVEPNICCNSCRFCQAGLPNICPDYRVLGESPELAGGLAEFIVVPARQVYALPSTVSSIEGALVQPLAISYEGVVQRGQVSSGEHVLVVGAGPIGLGATLLAKLQGAHVMVIDTNEHRVEVARGLGADLVATVGSDDVDDAVLAWTGGAGVDAAVEAVGGAQSQSLLTAQRLTAPRGRIVILGAFADELIPFPIIDVKNREQAIMGSHGHPRTFPPVIELITAGKLRPTALVSHTVGPSDVAAAFKMLDEQTDGVVKVIIQA